jgi:hypothetical protein
MRPTPAFRLTALAALTLACGSSFASDIHVDASCEIDSDYHLTLNERSLILTREQGEPKAIVMRQGRLFVDDRWVALDAADARRVAEFERGARAAMPEAQQIGREAAGIAFTALGEVAAALGNHPERVRAEVEKARQQLDARLSRVITPTHFSGRALGDGIGDALGDTLPTVIGEVVGGAVTAAFSGDVGRLQKLDDLDARIEAAVQPRADALGRRAEGLCRQMRALDVLEGALAYRHQGQRLELLQVRAPDKSDPPGKSNKP